MNWSRDIDRHLRPLQETFPLLSMSMRNFMVSPIVFPNYLFIFVVDINDVTIMIKFLGILAIILGVVFGCILCKISDENHWNGGLW